MKKGLAILLFAIMMATMFVGCSKTTDKSTDAGATTAAAAEEKTTEAVTEAATESVEKVTLSIFHHMSEENKRNGIEKLAEAYTALHPEITFDIQAIDFGQYATILKTKISAGETPDIMFGRPKAYSDLVGAGHIMDLTSQPYIDSIVPSALPCLTIDGKIYGIALDVSAMGAFYNKDIFEANGLKAPTNIDEYQNVLDVLKNAGVTPIARGFKDAWTAQVDFFTDAHQLLVKYPNMYGDITAGTKKFADYPELVGVYDRWAKHLEYSNDDIYGTDYSKSLEMFATGQTAMVNQGLWALGDIRKIAPDGNFGFFAVPGSNDANEVKLTAFADDAFMGSSSTKYPEQVNAFLEFVVSPEGAGIWSDVAGQVSYAKSSTTVYTDQVILDFLSYIDAGKVVGQEDGPTFSGQMDATFRESMELFPSLEDKDAAKFIANLDAEFDAIR